MASLEDKILGEKSHNYCSSSEGSDCEDESASETEKVTKSAVEIEEAPEGLKWEGVSQNTGPKGVIKDWQGFRQLEREKREKEERNCVELAKKLTLTVRTALDEEKEWADLEAELLDDKFLLEYQRKRMEEMLNKYQSPCQFGELIYLKNGEEFLNCIDGEDQRVTIIIHIYENEVEACRVMNECLSELCQLYTNTKFCAIKGSQAGVSSQFKKIGVPALLVYKQGSLIANLVKLTDKLGDHFYVEDVTQLLITHSILVDKSMRPPIIGNSYDSDSA
ncbi:hypothetical protein RI129_008649 [Pyrocoelia pectoralis]|uniref:Phosducin domain-containing protein n=1 Tax=Pyrocoelia pectoralis TaxID=417401 RepID=A0AAN7ZG75_9COLE